MDLAGSLRYGFVALLAASIAGCAGDTPPIARVVAAAAESHPAPPSGAKATEAAEPTDDLARALAAYEPPFPQRQEMFVPPKRSAESRHVQAEGGAVELKGFVEVDQPRAILDIDGIITSMSVGMEQYGVRVVSIEGTQVTLERNRTRWTATLE